MKTILFILLIASISLYGCKNNTSHTGHDHGSKQTAAPTKTTVHNHDDHDHDHDHDHGAENKHEHSGHEHDGHDHSDCEGDHDHSGHHHGEGNSEEAEHSDEIVFTREQAAKTDFEVQKIVAGKFHQVIKTTGQILAAPGDEVIVVANSNGIVSFNLPDLSEGLPVKQQTVLFQISSKNMAEGDYFSRTKAVYETAKLNYERARSLVKDKIISQREFEAIQLEYENAKINYEAIADTQTARGVSIKAPLAGFVKNILIKEGEYVTAGQPLATISQNRRLVLRAEVSQKHYQSLKSINTANFKTPYDNNVYSLSELNGKLLSYGKTSGEDLFYLPVSFEFDNKGDVIPGSFVEVYLISYPLENTLSVPVSALTNEMGYFYVYLQIDSDCYRKQEVSIGADNGKEVQILNGLHSGDRVVTRGAIQVKMAAASGAIPHGHSHEH